MTVRGRIERNWETDVSHAHGDELIPMEDLGGGWADPDPAQPDVTQYTRRYRCQYGHEVVADLTQHMQVTQIPSEAV